MIPGLSGHHHHHQHFGHHYRHHHHHPGPGLGAIAVGTAAGLATGALVGAAMARTSTTYANPQVTPMYPVQSPMVLAPTAIVAPSPVAFGTVSCAMPQTGLGVTVEIPAQAIQKQNGVTLFAINVFPENGGAPWQILRRYNDFHYLSTKLNLHRCINTPFPRKHLTGCEGDKLEQRRRGLQTWLQSVIQASPSVPNWIPQLKAFLEVDSHRVSVAPSAALATPVAPAMPIAIAQQIPTNSLSQAISVSAPPLVIPTNLEPQAPSASAPPLSPVASPCKTQQATSPPEQGSQCTIMDITVPAGVTPGQMLEVTVPSGQQALLEVPPGAMAGQVLQAFYDPVRGTLENFR